MRYLAAALILVLFALPALAQTQTYTFYGYVPCTKGQLGCAPWPEAPHPYVTFTFGNNLSYAQCKAYQTESRALVGDGFCEPYIQ